MYSPSACQHVNRPAAQPGERHLDTRGVFGGPGAGSQIRRNKPPGRAAGDLAPVSGNTGIKLRRGIDQPELRVFSRVSSHRAHPALLRDQRDKHRSSLAV